MKSKTATNTPLSELVSTEDLEGSDPSKISSLDDLGKIANTNTRSILALQRIREERRGAGISFTDVDEAIRVRQTRSANLIRRRQAIQVENLQKEKGRVLQEEIEPGVHGISSERKHIVSKLVELSAKVSRAKKIANEAGQRKIAAKLRAYEDAITNSLHLLDRLSNLDQLELEDV